MGRTDGWTMVERMFQVGSQVRVNERGRKEGVPGHLCESVTVAAIGEGDFNGVREPTIRLRLPDRMTGFWRE